MEVILLQDVEHLGLKGDVVGVKRGYARNYLLPRRLAEVASAGRVAEIRRLEAERAKHEARSVDQAQEMATTLGTNGLMKASFPTNGTGPATTLSATRLA